MTAPTTSLKRRLGFWLLTLYGVGVMIGAGIYVVVGQVVGQTGGWAPVTFLIAALIAAPTALAYAELSGRVPESAGEAAYVRTATGSGGLAALNGIMAQIVMASRVLFGLGRFSPVFSIFHKAHPRFGTPVLATVIPAVLAVVLALTAPLGTLAEITSLVLLAIFTAINVALIMIRRRDGARGMLPGWVPWLGAVLSLIALGWGVLS